MTKNSKLHNFQRFYAFFTEFLTDSVDWSVEKGKQERNAWKVDWKVLLVRQKGKDWLSSSLS